MALAKRFDSQKFEKKIYQIWEKANSFKPAGSGKAKTIIMPPPNANGSLHVGHAVFVTLEDFMTRLSRMRKDATLWLPGADHAGFETQVVYQKKLEREGRNFHKIARTKLYNSIKKFTLANKKLMFSQLKRLGASCDWSREMFTLDPRIVKIIYQNFKQLYEDGLIYRDNRLVHWCIKHQTTLSDLEVKHIKRKGRLYYIKYGRITVATTRPETMFGDVAVAVNPNDRRYRSLVGKKVRQPLTGRILPIIADKLVEKEFGTGALKITPAHDETDFAIGKSHNLPLGKSAFGKDGRLAGKLVPKKYQGLKTHIARKAVSEDLEKLGLLSAKPYQNMVAVCYKCQNPIEPLALPQWYIAMNKPSSRLGKSFRQLGLEALEKGEIDFVSPRFAKIYRHWLENLRDWNISRQIVWGIRIPAFFCHNSDCPPIITSGKPPLRCPECKGAKLHQDPDVFDTWFSSGQWAFAPLQALSQADFKKFYPTWVMETGHDILFFWVARMVMLSKYFTKKAPFKKIYLHGLVRDRDRQKMSKSKGNVIDPLGVIEKYGADSLRLALIFGTSAGNDIVISEEKIRGMRNFTNKLWNIARFILGNLDNNRDLPKTKGKEILEQTPADRRICRVLKETIQAVNKNSDKFNFHIVAEKLYHFVWHELADRYLEHAKEQFKKPHLTQTTQSILLYQLQTTLKLLHPLTPFVTEAIWQELYKRRLAKPKLLIKAPFPQN